MYNTFWYLCEQKLVFLLVGSIKIYWWNGSNPLSSTDCNIFQLKRYLKLDKKYKHVYDGRQNNTDITNITNTVFEGTLG